MKVCRFWIVAAGILLAGGCAASRPVTLELEKTITLPDVKGGFDLMACDVAGKRLFVAGQDNNSLEVIDLAAAKRIRSVPGLRQPKGIVYLADRRKLYVSNKDDGAVDVFDSESFAPIGRIDFKSKANNLRYDARSRTIYVGYGDGAIGTIRTADDSRGADVSLTSYPKQFRLEERGNRIFANVPVANSVVVIDRQQSKIIDTWPVREDTENVPMELDEANHRLFIACEPGTFVVINTDTGKSVATVKIKKEADGIQYDAARKAAYVSCGEGYLCVIRQLDSDRYSASQAIATVEGAGTSLFVPELDRLYLAVPQGTDHPAAIRVYRPMTNAGQQAGNR
jgi:YVTN family beta-propeller protein